MTTTYIGLDIGFDRLGYGIIRNGLYLDCGTIETDKEDAFGVRLAEIRDRITKVIADLFAQYPLDTFLVGIEKPIFVGKNKNAGTVVEVLGVIRLALYDLDIEPIEFTASTVKLNVTGIGNADKETVKSAVERILKVTFSKSILDDAIDGVAIAIVTKLHNMNAIQQNTKKPRKTRKSA